MSPRKGVERQRLVLLARRRLPHVFQAVTQVVRMREEVLRVTFISLRIYPPAYPEKRNHTVRTNVHFNVALCPVNIPSP